MASTATPFLSSVYTPPSSLQPPPRGIILCTLVPLLPLNVANRPQLLPVYNLPPLPQIYQGTQWSIIETTKLQQAASKLDQAKILLEQQVWIKWNMQKETYTNIKYLICHWYHELIQTSWPTGRCCFWPITWASSNGYFPEVNFSAHIHSMGRAVYLLLAISSYLWIQILTELHLSLFQVWSVFITESST